MNLILAYIAIWLYSYDMSLKAAVTKLKALADPTRLKIVALLARRPFCVCELTVALGLSQPTISRHLQQLEAAGFLISERQGSWVIYHLQPADEDTAHFLDSVLGWLAEDTELEGFIQMAVRLDRHECSQKMREASSSYQFKEGSDGYRDPGSRTKGDV